MVQLKVIFDTRKKKADGTYSIYFRITELKKVFYLHSGFSVQPQFWNDKDKRAFFKLISIFQSLMIKIVNLNMETFVIHPENKEQLAALKALVKSWNINFEKYPYDPNFVAEINKREKNIKKGDFITIKDPGNVWESLL